MHSENSVIQGNKFDLLILLLNQRLNLFAIFFIGILIFAENMLKIKLLILNLLFICMRFTKC